MPLAQSRGATVAICLVFLLPALHPMLRPLVGVPSHLLWFAHVLPVAWSTYHRGSRGGGVSIVVSLLLLVLGERMFGAGYFVAADWQTVVSLTVALGFTHTLVAGFAAYARRARSLQEQLWHSQKMETLGLFAASVAHDFNNMLTAITLSTEMALEEMDPADPERYHVVEIRRAAERAALLSKRLLAFSRREVAQPVERDVSSVVADLEGMLRRLVSRKVELRIVSGPGATIVCDPGHLEQILMNLVVNASDAIPDSGTITVTTRTSQPGELPREHDRGGAASHVLIEVADTGMGMDAALQRRIFEPLFTTKPAGKGTGLGLSTVKDLVSAAGGSVSVTSALGRGSVFRVYLPLKPGAASLAAQGGHSGELRVGLAS